jgi:hypothetical protein
MNLHPHPLTNEAKAAMTNARGLKLQDTRMPRRPAKVTQADIARAIRAAKDAGAREISVDSDGVIRIALVATAAPTAAAANPDAVWSPSETLQRHLKRTESG